MQENSLNERPVTSVGDLDALLRPIANGPMEAGFPDDLAPLQAAAEPVLRELIAAYAAGGEPVRAEIRGLFDRHPSFRWAATLPRDWSGAAELRDRLIHLCARDQGADTRDEILTLRALCEQARAQGIDPAPIVAEVAGMASDTDRYGMGSMRTILRNYA